MPSQNTIERYERYWEKRMGRRPELYKGPVAAPGIEMGEGRIYDEAQDMLRAGEWDRLLHIVQQLTNMLHDDCERLEREARSLTPEKPGKVWASYSRK
jgi:hypothetical protein